LAKPNVHTTLAEGLGTLGYTTRTILVLHKYVIRRIAI